MENYALLISPRAEQAFFAQYQKIALAETASAGFSATPRQVGEMLFLDVEAEADRVPDLLRLACVQGVFHADGAALTPVDQGAGFHLHPDFVFGEKYRGKTNEILTQLLINLCLHRTPSAQTLLDPMSGRGTTVLWAMRYGLRAWGVEQDGQVLVDMRRGLKKWTKLHRQKHKLSEGWIRKTNKKGIGKYLEFAAQDTAAKVVIGSSADPEMMQRKKFDIIATDIPYGVQHLGGRPTRNPIEIMEEVAPAWAASLAPGGTMAIAFNANLPKRKDLIAAFDGLGLTLVDTDLSHRMSESILRDILIFTRS